LAGAGFDGSKSVTPSSSSAASASVSDPDPASILSYFTIFLASSTAFLAAAVLA